MLKIIKEEIETKLKDPTIAKNKYTNLEKNHKSAFKIHPLKFQTRNE